MLRSPLIKQAQPIRISLGLVQLSEQLYATLAQNFFVLPIFSIHEEILVTKEVRKNVSSHFEKLDIALPILKGDLRIESFVA